MSHYVLGIEESERNTVHTMKYVDDLAEARLFARRQICLRDIAGDHCFGAEANAGEEHFHLLGRRVLRFIENDERLVERATAHERKRGHLNHISLNESRNPIKAHHFIKRVVHRAQVRIHFLSEIARQKSQPLTGFDCRPHQHNSADTIRRERFDRARDREIRFARARRTDAESQIPCPYVRQIVALVSASRTDTAAWYPYRIVVLVRVADNLPGLPLLQREVHALGSNFLDLCQIKQLPQRIFGAFRLDANDTEVVAAPADLYIQARFEQAQILVQRTAQICQPSVVGGLEIEVSLRWGLLGLGR